MTRLLNVLGLVAALGLAMVATVYPRSQAFSESDGEGRRTRAERTTLPDGRPALLDFGGLPFAIQKYQRIASASTISDSLLLEYISPSRIVSFTNYSTQSKLTGHRFTDKPQLDALGNLESLIALKPDLVLVSTLSSSSHVARLRDAGLTVFSLGEMRGVDSFLASAEALSVLLDCEDLGQHYVATFRRRLRAVTQAAAAHATKTAIYMIFYGGKIFGSGTQTSYHDVMTAAGLRDLGAEHYSGWPDWSPEQVLTLDPEVIITRAGLARVICETQSLRGLRVCRGQGQIVEVPEELLNDPGPGILAAAEEVYEQVYGRTVLKR